MKLTRWFFGLAWITLAGVSPASGTDTGAVGRRPTPSQVQPNRTVLELHPSADKSAPGADSQVLWQGCVALPPDAGRVELRVDREDQPRVCFTRRDFASLRGQVVVPVTVALPDSGNRSVRVEIRHDGNWDQSVSRVRNHGRGFFGAVGPAVAGWPEPLEPLQDGCYLIITPPEFLGAVQPLADWKRRKGLPTRVATTDSTGPSNTEIREWIRQAYATWEVPPEYVLLIGDTDQMPAWQFHGTVTDLPYSLLDGDDWLPDVLLGRLSVATLEQAASVIAKTINYERSPYFANTRWFDHALMVAGDYAAMTPVSTARWCGRQLHAMGFARADTVFFPPITYPAPISASLNAGVSLVAFRGWAYGSQGWEMPRFLNSNIYGLANAGMTPVVLSFTCLSGNFAETECFGEAWIRAGTSTEPKGAVAFLGAAEHWTHTRYNDALAIATFERFVDPAVSSLGPLALASKLRFADYFPHERDYAEHGAESMEYYFHTYNLLGDPELNLWKSVPPVLSVTHADSLPAGSNFLDVSVAEADNVTPLADARVGVVQGETWLGCAYSDASGLARIPLPNVSPGSPLAITVTHPDRRPYEGLAAISDGSAFLALLSCVLDDVDTGNGDGLANPGETVRILVNLTNGGTQPARNITGTLVSLGHATVDQGTVTFPDMAGGDVAQANAPFQVTLSQDVQDRQQLLFRLETAHDSSSTDLSELRLPVSAPTFRPDTTMVGGDGYADPGETIPLTVTLQNTGSQGTAGITALLILDDPTLGTIVDSLGTYGPIPAGGTADNAGDPFEIHVYGTAAIGSALPFRIQLRTAEGYATGAVLALQVGRVDAGAPTGPDVYGYYAYDNGDVNYPSQAPSVVWEEISPRFGGSGSSLISAPTYPQVGSVLLTLPFDFTFYGVTQRLVRVFRDGYLSFDPEFYYSYYNWPLPSAYASHSLAAPFWDTFAYFSDDPNQDGIYYFYDAAAGKVIVEWSQMRHAVAAASGSSTFQLVLYDPVRYPTPSGDGELVYLYQQVYNNDISRNFATVGMEDPSEQDGLQYTYANLYAPGAAPVDAGRAIRITTWPPVYTPASGVTPMVRSSLSCTSLPNPAPGSARLVFATPAPAPTTLSVFDSGGRRVRDLLKCERTPAGPHELRWDGRDDQGGQQPAGVYFYRLQSGCDQITGSIVLVR